MMDFDDRNRNAGPLAWVFALVVLVPIVYCANFYLRYAAEAWFFQDDFFFLRDYELRLHAEQWLSAENFGRFVSRNLYWWAGWNLLGENAHGYFIFNLSLMLCTSLLFLILCFRHSIYLGLILGLAYWTSGATVGNLSWLSNSQHLLAHTFMAVYFCLIQRAWQQKSMSLLLLSVVVYAVALSANILSAVAMLLPFLMLCQRPQGRYALAMSAMLAVQIAMALSVLIAVRPEVGSPYALKWSWSVVASNMNFYYGHPVVFLGLSAVLAKSAWSRHRSGDYLEAWVLLAGPAFIFPFLPLVQQKYLNYAAFSHVFMLAGLCVFACRTQVPWVRFLAWGIVVFSVWKFSLQTYQQMTYFKSERRGAVQREFIKSLNEMVRNENTPDGSILCFIQKNDKRHVAGEPMPGFWWGIGAGEAFKKFVGAQYSYSVLEDGVACAHVFQIDGSRLRLMPR